MKAKRIIGTIEIQNGIEMMLTGHDSNGKELFKSTAKMNKIANKKASYSFLKKF